ncbi:ATP-binding cassette sub-family A member 3, partial [Harpegnathos saltator]
PSIQVRCVSRRFGRIDNRVTAVDDVTIDFYRHEFSVILGHNGAGKSCLLKMIIGMYKPTHGRVYLEGRDENEGTVDPIGYCPQENILVDYLTTVQHLYMFGMVNIVVALRGIAPNTRPQHLTMKGMTYEDAYRESLKLLKQLNLESVKDSKVKNCFFSAQRRICLAMALIGNTKILVLDEPTYGIDLGHRRQMWDLLSDIKRKKTILMATNSMEAADLLADRIAIIVNGRIECYGSKMYLNRRYGIGYVLSLLMQEGADTERLHEEVQNFSPDPIALRSVMGLVVRFDVPRNSRFTKLLQHLESKKEELGIVSITLSIASIEGQLLRIGLSSHFKERSVELPDAKYELLVQKRRRDLLRKCNIILAIVTLTLTTMISELSSFVLFDMTERTMNLTHYVHINDLHVLYYAAAEKSARDFLVALYTTGQSYSDRHNYHISKNISAMDLMIHPDLQSIEVT